MCIGAQNLLDHRLRTFAHLNTAGLPSSASFTLVRRPFVCVARIHERSECQRGCAEQYAPKLTIKCF